MLMTNVKAHKLRSQFLKSYSVAQQAFKQMEADDVSLDPSTYVYDKDSTNNMFYKNYMKYFKGTIDCGSSAIAPLECGFNPQKHNFKTFDGSVAPFWPFDDGSFIIQDGSLFMVEEHAGSSNILVSIDINGYKTPPNRWGVDLFTFQFLDGGLYTMGDLKTKYNNLDKYCNLNSNDELNGIACAHRAKTETDYFKWAVKNVK